MRDDSRDVYHDMKSKTYRRSSTWNRRLRRTARKHMIACEKMNERKLSKYWARLARNG